MAWFEGPSARLFYLDEGEGPPLVFVNGLIMATSHWAPQAEALGSAHRLIRYDQRCQGRSEGDRGFHYTALVEDLRLLLDHLEVERASICGISYGSFVAKEFAIRHPARCDNLVLIASMRAIDAQLRCVYDVWSALLAEGRIREFAQSVTMLSYDRPWPEVVERTHDVYLEKFERRTQPEDVLALLRSFNDAKDLRNHAQIRARTLVLGASRDRIHAPEDSVVIAQAIPGAQLVMLEGSHALTLDRAEQVNDHLRAFLASTA